PYGPANMQVMEKLKTWAKANGLLTESAVLFAIPQDNPETTRPESCRFDACIVIPHDDPLDEVIAESEFAGGKYAICKVKHTTEDIQKAWAEIIPALYIKGYQIDNKPMLERYTGELLNKGYCEICVPVL
ncbi:GyrI-like domain-containing protein, partial [Peribacillus sp. NPDC056705]|uniref:AraC family transcriptional regulator n=1 Tax=Peribacillus sp. NPDC056705 TaxID=3345918 RepID=UPI00374979AB